MQDLREKDGLQTRLESEIWKKYSTNPIIEPSSGIVRFDNNYIALPYIVDNGTDYYLYYTGVNNRTGHNQYHECGGLAISKKIDDSWTKYNASGYEDSFFSIGVPGHFDYWRAWGPETVIREDATSWKMWYCGDSNGAKPHHVCRVGYATSTDGKEWTRYNGSSPLYSVFEDMDGVSSGGRGVIHLSILKENAAHYKMIYCIYGNNNIKYATSKNGIVWNIQNNGNPVISGSEGRGSVGSLNKIGNTYYLVFCGGSNTCVDIYTSTDCISWKKHPDQLLTSSGEWDEDKIFDASIIKKSESEWLMVYAGYKKSPLSYTLGFATLNRSIPLKRA